MRYFPTHPCVETYPDEDIVTIGIGCICESGECIVMASDMRATYGIKPHGAHYQEVGPNDQCGKVFRISPYTAIASVAGQMSQCHAVVSEMVANIRRYSKSKKFGRQHVIAAIEEARGYELRRVYSWAMQANWGITLREFAVGKVPGGKLDRLLIRAGYHLLRNTPFKVELIVGGFIRGHAVFVRAVQKGKLEEESSPGVYAIGAGQRYAMKTLNKRGQHFAMSLQRTLLHVHEALIAAKAEKTVGNATGYIVLRSRAKDIVYMPADAPILETWRKAYKDRPNTASLDDSHVAAMDVFQQLIYVKLIKTNK